VNWPIMPIHAVLLPDGRVLSYGTEPNGTQTAFYHYDVWYPQSGTEPTADNYAAWTITRKGLYVTFDPYQVAAYAAGPQYILVPYSVLKDIIKPDGPIANYASQ